MAVVANQAVAFDKSMLTACPHFVSRMHRGRQTAVLATQGITLADNTGSSENHNFSVSDSVSVASVNFISCPSPDAFESTMAA